MKKLVIGGASIAALAAGSLAVSTLSPLQLAGARDRAPAVEVQAGQEGDSSQAGQGQDKPDRANWRRGGKPGARIEKFLDELVKDGTITQEQAEKIKAKIKEKVGSGRGGHDGRGDLIRAGLVEAAKSIGISAEQLKEELKSGKSVAEVAQAHGVDPQKVIDDLVAAATAKIDEAVAAGKIPADRAAEIKANLPERISRLVNSKHGPNGPGGHRDGIGRPDKPKPPSGDEGTATEPPSTRPPSTEAPKPPAEAPDTSPTTADQPSTGPNTGGDQGGGTDTTWG